MAYIVEENRLGVIQLGQKFRPLALGLVRSGVVHTLRDRARQEGVKSLVGRPSAQERAQPGDDEAERLTAARTLHRKKDDIVRGRKRCRARSDEDRSARLPGHVERPEHDVAESDLARRGGSTELGVHPGERGDASGVVEDVNERRRNVGVSLGQDLCRCRASLRRRLCAEGTGQRVQESKAPLLDDLIRSLYDRAEHAADSPGLVMNRAIREREVGLLRRVAPHERQHQVFRPRGFAGCTNVLKQWLDDFPNFREHLERGPAHRLRVLVRAHHGQQALVVEHDELRTPIERNGETRIEAEPDRGTKTLGPLRERAEHTSAPVD